MTSPAFLPGFEDDPDIRAKAKEIVLASYDEMLDILRSGIPSMRAEIAKRLAPTVAVVLREKNTDEELAELRRQLTDLYAELHSTMTTPDTIPTLPADPDA